MNLKSATDLFKGEQLVAKTVGCTLLAAVCGYGGTFFFTLHNPTTAAFYLASAALTSQVAYHVLEKIQDSIPAQSSFKHVISIVQLLQIPVAFYLFSGFPGMLSGVAKLEVLTATAYFVAIPVFFKLGIEAWHDPSVANIVAAIGVLLPLANGLGGYARNLR